MTSDEEALLTPQVRNAEGAGGLVSEPTARSHSVESCVQLLDTNGGFVCSFMRSGWIGQGVPDSDTMWIFLHDIALPEEPLEREDSVIYAESIKRFKKLIESLK